MADSFTIESLALAKLVQLLHHIGQDDLALRTAQSMHAERVAVEEFGTVTDAAIVLVDEAQSGDQTYSFMAIIFETTAGTGRYRITGANPSAAGVGVEIAAGGTVIEVAGKDNIKNFRMIAETGQTLPYAMLVFK